METGNFRNEELSPERIFEQSDIAIDKKSGLAIVVIKPDAFRNKDLIIKKIENSGLYIAKTVTKKLPDNFVIGEMYKDLPVDIKDSTLDHFNLGPAELVLVEGGQDLLDKIIKLTGEKTNPAECDEKSIRYLFGEHFPRKTEAGNDYSHNAVHRAKNDGERTDDLDKFEPFF